MSGRMSRRQFIAFMSALGGASALAACAPGPAPASQQTGTTPAAGTPKQGGTFTLGTNQGVPQLDPHIVTYANERNVYPGLYNGLTEYDPDMNVVPALAESWEHSDDLKTYTWHLRKGVKFHNGREMEAEDVKWCYERCLDPALGSQLRNNVQEVESIEVPDKYTVVMHLSSPSATLPMGAQELKIFAKIADHKRTPRTAVLFEDFIPERADAEAVRD